MFCFRMLASCKVRKVLITKPQLALLRFRSARLDLQQIALQIFQTCIRNKIELDVQWVPRDCNEQADLLSRFVDKDDWAVNARIFRIIDAKWGPHTIDRFASYYNSQLPRFNSEHASPRSSGVDSFAQDWSNDNNWLCPPVNLIVQTIRKLQSCNGIGTLIIPEWPSSLFWPYLHSSDLVFRSYVKAVFCLPKLHDLLIEGPGQRAVYKRKKSVFSRCPSFNMLALRLHCKN